MTSTSITFATSIPTSLSTETTSNNFQGPSTYLITTSNTYATISFQRYNFVAAQGVRQNLLIYYKYVDETMNLKQ